jgi:hypothetical protein
MTTASFPISDPNALKKIIIIISRKENSINAGRIVGKVFLIIFFLLKGRFWELYIIFISSPYLRNY